jgi:hypothetical protein
LCIFSQFFTLTYLNNEKPLLVCTMNFCCVCDHMLKHVHKISLPLTILPFLSLPVPVFVLYFFTTSVSCITKYPN